MPALRELRREMFGFERRRGVIGRFEGDDREAVGAGR
jgi:hypothetical protein